MAKEEEDDKDYETRCKAVCVIAHPLASKKLNKKILKVVKKATKANSVKRGVKEVVKGMRKGVKGIVFLAGDISPIDVFSHIPILCEDADIPYAYVPSKDDLGSAGLTKRPTSVVMVVFKKDVDYTEAYDELLGEIKSLNKSMITA